MAVVLSGYRVESFSVSLFSPDRRGRVQPGTPWAPWGREWGLYLLAAPAPLPAGIAVLCCLGIWTGPGIDLWDWRTWVAALLSLSMAAELAPSDMDLKALTLPGLVFVGLALVGGLGIHLFSPSLESLLVNWAAHLAPRVTDAALSALGQVVMGVVLAGVPLLLLRDR